MNDENEKKSLLLEGAVSCAGRKVKWFHILSPEYSEYPRPWNANKTICFFSFVIVFCLFFCFGCGGPWPSISVDTQGLGQGPIADYLKLPAWDHEEKRIADKVKLMLEIANSKNTPRSSAESIGMVCSSLPSKMCQYKGVVIYQAHGTPKENTLSGEPTKILIEITLKDYENPSEIIVKKTKTIIRYKENCCGR